MGELLKPLILVCTSVVDCSCRLDYSLSTFVFMLVVVAKLLPSIDLVQITKQQRTTEEDRAIFSGVQSTVLLSEFRFERVVN